MIAPRLTVRMAIVARDHPFGYDTLSNARAEPSQMFLVRPGRGAE
jgi:hypothetical protein